MTLTDDDTPWQSIDPNTQLLIDQEKWIRGVFLEHQREVHKAKMANRKLARQNMEPASGTWMYKTNRAGAPAKAVQRRITGLGIPIDLGRREDRSMFGYNYLEYLK